MLMGVDVLLLEEFVIESAECVEHIATHMNEVVDSDCLEIVGAGRCAGNYEFSASVEIFECSGCEFGIFVVA